MKFETKKAGGRRYYYKVEDGIRTRITETEFKSVRHRQAVRKSTKSGFVSTKTGKLSKNSEERALAYAKKRLGRELSMTEANTIKAEVANIGYDKEKKVSLNTVYLRAAGSRIEGYLSAAGYTMEDFADMVGDTVDDIYDPNRWDSTTYTANDGRKWMLSGDPYSDAFTIEEVSK